nr:retrovirus-related Pol polyprotein from transposon TNT 1-94 [Tanacetum cinerariifolium]
MATKYEIKKFNGNNFSLWKLKMKAILQKDKCLAAIGKRPAEVTDDSKWGEMDGNAIENLHLALADGRKLYALLMTKSTSVTEHVNNLNTLFSQLASLDCKIDVQERAKILLQSLHDSYDQVVIYLTNNVLTDCLVFDDVAASILEEENRRNNRDDRQTSSKQVEALVVTKGKSMEPRSSGSHNHGKSKTEKKKNNFKCFKCGKQSYFKKDCRGSNTSNPQGNVASTSDDGNDMCCEAAVANEGRKRFADVCCNDHELKIIGIRSIMVKMHDGERKPRKGQNWIKTGQKREATVRTIRDVRHVEGLKKNLLSLGQLDDLGCKVEIQNKIIKIIKGTLVLMIGEKVATNLYQLKGEIMKDAEASVASHSPSHKVTISWHQKLGHMSEQGMNILVDKKLLPGLTKVSLPFCEYCVISKQHRLKFKASNSRSVSVLELVHSDVWQAPVQSLGGAKYFVSFIDDYSRIYWVYPIKKKSDVFEVFKVYKARVEIDSRTKIKQFTIAYIPQWNRVAERMNRTLLERARAMLATASLGKLFWAEAVNTACYVINRSPSTAVELKTPMEMWTGNPVKGMLTELRGIACGTLLLTKLSSAEMLSLWKTKFKRMKKVLALQGKLQQYRWKKDGEPSTLQEALNNPDASFWKEAMQEEIEALHKNKTWELVPLPGGRNPFETNGCVRSRETMMMRWREQLDVKTAFLHRNLEEEIYMLQPEGFKQKGKENSVTRDLILSLGAWNITDYMQTLVHISRVGGLMFAMICTRPEIAHVVGVVSRYMAEPGRGHWEAVKRILRYVKGTSDVALCFGDSDVIVTGYVDSDYACDLDESKSTNGYVFTLSGGTVSLVSKLQSVVVMSTTEAE